MARPSEDAVGDQVFGCSESRSAQRFFHVALDQHHRCDEGDIGKRQEEHRPKVAKDRTQNVCSASNHAGDEIADAGNPCRRVNEVFASLGWFAHAAQSKWQVASKALMGAGGLAQLAAFTKEDVKGSLGKGRNNIAIKNAPMPMPKLER